MTPLVLASGSPRRRDLVRSLGRQVTIEPADIDETRRAGESPVALVERLALTKADAVANRLGVDGDAIVVGADTVVAIDGDVLGKPADTAEATAMLRRLSGREHEVVTGVALRRGSLTRTFAVTTFVRFVDLTSEDIERYVATGEPLDKAGAYGIQGGAGRFVIEVHGSYQNIVGLPVAHLVAALGDLEALSDDDA